MQPAPSIIMQNDLKTALDVQREWLLNEFTKVIKNQTASLNTIIQKQATEIDRLSNIVTHQALRLETLETSSRCKQAIIFGIPENDEANLRSTVQKLITDTNVDVREYPLSPQRLGKKGVKPRPVRVQFASEDIKRKIVEKFRELKSNTKYNGIFMAYDLPPLTVRENNRLRDKLKELKSANPIATHKITKGKLHSNGVVVDEFNIANQLQNF